MEKYEIGIIIINYNSSSYTVDCVKSILDKSPQQLFYKIVVVDNASQIEDFKNLKEQIGKLDNKNILVSRSMINLGFGGGNMFGVQHINAKYYAFINNDTVLLNDCLSILKGYMDETPEVAVSGPQMLNQNNERMIDFDHFVSVERELFGSKLLELMHSKKYPARKCNYDNPVIVNYVNGSFMLFRAESFHLVGGFDTNIFLFFEESDICYRLLEKGGLTSYVPEAKYIHYQGRSMPKPIITKIELKTSMFYVIRKHQGYYWYLLLRLIFIVRYGLIVLVKPKYLPLLYRIIIGLPLSKSLKLKQEIHKF